MYLKHILAASALALSLPQAKADKPTPRSSAFQHYVAIQEDTLLKKSPANWFNLDIKEDNLRGLSTEKAYRELLKNKKPQKTIIVAVIDSGVDIAHEDLKDVLWTNPKEIPGNGIDDDKNGYIDDVHGWNFIGGKDGKHVAEDSYELTREYVRLKKKYEGKKVSDKNKDYQYYLGIKQEFEKKRGEAEQGLSSLQQFAEMYKNASELLKKHLKVTELSAEKVESITTQNKQLADAKGFWLYATSLGVSSEADFEEAFKYYKSALDFGYNEKFDPRSIVGDNYQKLREKGYGNNDLIGPDARHGTHVAGIIAANRKNNKGIMGVADNVQIMVIRAVPDGDERDKDIANAIFYAVDNGAHIINMSFGKSYSPNKDFVDEAVKYAESKGVLLVHAAGNDAKNLEVESNFPNKSFAKGKGEAKLWLEVGASSWKADNMEFVANFSNYGKTKVDIFAPGVDLYATTPQQSYEYLSGTSMAAPATSGVAALVMSYYPELSAQEVRTILMESSVKYKETVVNKPGTENSIPFGELSVSGGIANAYEALLLAEKMSQGKKKK